MQKYIYSLQESREPMTLDDIGSTLNGLATYLIQEHKKGKIPLIIAGAGVSTRHLERIDSSDNKILYDKGLPGLGAMIQKIEDLVNKSSETSPKMKTLVRLFEEINPDHIQNKKMDLIDREWIGKLFVTLSDVRDSVAHGIWQKFCNWFFFECCENDGQVSGGALNIGTSQADKEIAKMYESLDAICLSANFDGFLEYALSGSNGTACGISLFSKKYMDSYFQRNRRGSFCFSSPPHNRCVLHANGDILWLHCSGDKDEGYCPNRGKYFPAFFDRRHIRADNILQCQICGSQMEPTMTMPGTYQKDYNTRQIISSIWEYIAPKLSCVITVGLSCNWDDVLLKFILGLLIEREIPHLDINDFSDHTYADSTAIVRQIVQERRFQSRCIQADASVGLKRINEILCKINEESRFSKQASVATFEDIPSFFDELVKLLEEYEEIQHLKCISQLGLKPLSTKSNTIADNDRWSHSKQVAKNAYKIYHRMCKNSRKQETTFEQVLICTAGLLHDCGHLPFSHLLEDVFEELSWGISDDGTSFKHNQYSRILIRRFCKQENSPLKCFLEKYGVTSEDVILLIEGNYGIGYLDTLINSAIDADKIAYIFTDAKQMRRALLLNEDEFIEKLTEKAYITQEGLVALDSTSAWYAFRLLDERKRLYDELYLDPHVRCMEAAAKYIITTYFVQKYNSTEFVNSQMTLDSENLSDLGGYRIMRAIDDMLKMRNNDYDYLDLSTSVGERTKKSLKRCMEIVLMNTISNEQDQLEEQKLLKNMYLQLTGEVWNNDLKSCSEIIEPYQDDQIQNMANTLSYRKLADVRKRIILNYPGLLLVDLHKPIQYYSTPTARQSHYRIDGTNCAQDTIMLPNSKRTTWQDTGCRAAVTLSKYVQRYEYGVEQRPVFQVFKIGDNQTDCEHAIDMLKKELQKQTPRKEDVL